jgi:hypothetical protein
MNPQQKSVTLAFMLVFGAMALRNNWYNRAKEWLSTPAVGSKSAAKPPTTTTIYGVRNWQAAFAAYIILMVIAETPAGELTPPIAWGVGLIELFAAFGTGSGTLPSTFPGVFGQSTQATATPASGSTGANNGSA